MKLDTTVDLFNYFHDELKETIIDAHWMNKFCEISGVDISTAKDCYWYNIEIPNDEVANEKLCQYIASLGHNCNTCTKCCCRESDAIDEVVCFCGTDNNYICYQEDAKDYFCTEYEYKMEFVG